jgi:hypothetical protein
VTHAAPTTSTPPAPLTRGPESPLQLWLNLSMSVALALTIAGATLQAYRIAQEFGSLRSSCLVAGMAAGIGLAFTLGGAIHYLVLLLNERGARPPAWYMRWPLTLARRGLYLGQIAGTALAVACVAAVLFNLAIPGPDYGMLHRGGYTPPLPPPMIDIAFN